METRLVPPYNPRHCPSTGAPVVARTYDVMPDGSRFFGMTRLERSAPGPSNATQINVVLHWFEELKQRVPVR